MTEEIWKTAVYDGEIYEGLYKVSNLGRIKNPNYRNTGKERLMKTSKDKDGYLKVGLSKNGKEKTCKVHRLVAQTFISNPENLPFVNHKIDTDEGKTMNMVIFNEDGTINKEKTTIEWCDSNYNNNYGTRNERISKTKINGKKSKKVLQLSLDGHLIREWPSTRECGRNSFDQGAVAACCRGEKPHYKGFLWKYS